MNKRSAAAVKLRSLWLVGNAVLPCALWSYECRATGIDEAKRACVAAADQGQLLRDGGQYSAARQQFTHCAAEDCPPLVREQCATWLGQVVSSTPTVVFAAIDGDGKDLAMVSVAADGRRVAERLDGRPVELDPGPHEIRFEAEGHAAAIVRVMLRAGDKNRAIGARFPDRVSSVWRGPSPPPQESPISFWDGRSVASLSLLTVGTLSAATGLYFAIVSRNKANEAASLRQGRSRDACSQAGAPTCSLLSDAVDLQRQDFLASSVFYVVGGAFAAAAVTTWLAWPQKADRNAAAAAFVLRPTLGPGSAGLRLEVALQ